jgi:hypothetical protein
MSSPQAKAESWLWWDHHLVGSASIKDGLISRTATAEVA